MGGFPIVFIGFELEKAALDTYPRDFKVLLQDVEALTNNPASIVRYDDNDCTHIFVCCFADLRQRAYSSKELEAIPIPAAFSLLPKRMSVLGGDLQRHFAPKAMVFSYGRDGKTRVKANTIIG